MSECEAMSERMPAVVAGRAEWTPAELEHLATCRECGEEWTLVAATAGLGREAAARLEVGRVAAAVTSRLADARRADRERRLRWRNIAGAALAAAASVALAVGVHPPARQAPGPIPDVAPAGATPSTTAPVSVAPAPSADGALPNAGTRAHATTPATNLALPVPELDSLDAPALQSVLESLDGALGAGQSLTPEGLDDLNDHELERVLGSEEG